MRVFWGDRRRSVIFDLGIAVNRRLLEGLLVKINAPFAAGHINSRPLALQHQCAHIRSSNVEAKGLQRCTV